MVEVSGQREGYKLDISQFHGIVCNIKEMGDCIPTDVLIGQEV